MNKIRRLSGLAFFGLLATSATYASNMSFSYMDAAQNDLSATFSLNVVGGVAQSGTGTVTSSLLGTDTLELITAQSTLPAGDGSIDPTGNPVPSGFTWHGVPNSGGADFLADNVVNSTPNYLDQYGLIFALVSPTTSNIVGALYLSADHNSADTMYDTIVGFNSTCNGPCYGGAATGTLAPVPLPAAAWLLVSGLAGLSLHRRRPALTAG